MSENEHEVEALCREQFDEAASREAVDGYIYANGPKEYYFGKSIPVGLRALGRIPRPRKGPVTVLDVGAGKGDFLYGAKLKYRSRAKAIGFTAANHVLEKQEGIEWVYGDIQRRHTWQPPDALRPGSIDVAVSSLLFGHLVHPAAAVRNILQLLKPRGNLYIDSILFKLDPKKSLETAGMIAEDLRRNQGNYGLQLSYDDGTHTGQHCVIANNVHIQRRGPIILDKLRPTVQKTISAQIVYTV